MSVSADAGKTVLSKEERRARREARRARQRTENVGRAAKMHKARLEMAKVQPPRRRTRSNAPAQIIHVGCSGWFYWKWRGLFYPAELPTGDWFDYYAGEVQHGGDQRVVLLLAYSREHKGMEAAAGTSPLYLHGQGL